MWREVKKQLLMVSVTYCKIIVKRPVLPPCAVDGCSRNPLYYYYYCILMTCTGSLNGNRLTVFMMIISLPTLNLQWNHNGSETLPKEEKDWRTLSYFDELIPQVITEHKLIFSWMRALLQNKYLIQEMCTAHYVHGYPDLCKGIPMHSLLGV